MATWSELRRAHLAEVYLPSGHLASMLHDVSEGPWFGFNGVKTLAITSDSLMLCRSSSFRRHQFWVEVVPFEAIGEVTTSGKLVVATIGSRRRRLATKTSEEVLRLANELGRNRR